MECLGLKENSITSRSLYPFVSFCVSEGEYEGCKVTAATNVTTNGKDSVCGQCGLGLRVFVDSDHAGKHATRRSCTGYLIYLNMSPMTPCPLSPRDGFTYGSKSLPVPEYDQSGESPVRVPFFPSYLREGTG